MISIKETKKKFTTIVIISLFIATMFYFNPENTLSNISEEPQINEQLTDSDINIPSTKSSVIDYDTWYTGPSVKTDIEFNKQSVDMPIENVWSTLGSSPDYITYGYENIFVDDGNLAYFVSSRTDGVKTDLGEAKFYMKIYCGGAGTLTYEWYLYFSYYDTGVSKGGPLSTRDSTLAVTSSMLDSQGYLHLMFYGTTAGAFAFEYFYYVDFTGETSISSSSTGGMTITGVHSYNFRIDELQFLRDTVTNDVRSTYKYNSPTTITHSVNPPGFAFAKEMNIYYNEDEWTYSSITPTASVTDSSYTLTINSPTEIDYEVLFTSKCSNHLAIEDISTNYLTDVGFETGEYSSDWWYGTDTWETKEIATDIVSEGSYSLHLERTADYDALGLYGVEDGGTIENGYYYFSFDVYFVENTGDPKMIFMQEGGSSWYSFDMSSYSTDMWHKIFIYSPIIYSSSQSCVVRLRINTGTVDMYLDNFRMFQTSTTIETFGYSEAEVSSALISWDGYKNPSIPYTDVEMELWDRCDQVLEESYSTTTNEYGVATWILEKGLEQKEYEIRSYTIDSYFSASIDWVDTEEKTESLTEWVAITESTLYLETSNVQEGDYAIKNTKTSGVANYLNPRYDNAGTKDFSNVDYFSFWLYRDSSNPILTFNVYFYTTGGDYFLLDIEEQCPNDQTWYHIRIATTDFTESGSPDSTALEYIYFRMEIDAAINDYLLIDDLKAIHSSKLYFTPSYPTEPDYAETELNDAWDFEEGDFDLTMVSGSTANEVIENGYYSADCDTASYNTLLLQDSDLDVSVDCSYYTHLLFRAKMDDWVDGGYRWEFTAYDGASPYDTEFYYTDSISPTDSEYGEWVTWLVDLRTTTNFRAGYQWGVDFTTLDKIQIYHTGGQAHEMTEDLWIDYVAFVHVDSWLEETNDYATDELLDAWDFEEGDEEDTTPYSTASHGCENGYGYFVADSDWDGYYFENLDTDSGYYNTLVFEVWADASVTGNQFYIDYRDDANANLGYEYGTALSTTWTVYKYTIDSSYVADIDEIRFKFHSSFDDYNVEVRFDYVRLIHQEEMPYSVIQNSVLLESETNDLQYNLYLDHNFIGTFSDLSLIPVPQSAGTHYLSIQPFRTDDPYSTQQIFSYYYTVEADSFAVSVENFYLSDDYANLFVTSNYDCSYEITSGGSGSGSVDMEGTTISVTRITTPGSEVTLTIEFTYDSETVTFTTRYNNPVSAFYVESYTIDIQEENIEIIWSTTKTSTDSLTVYEDGSLTTVDGDTTSPSAWAKSSTVGVHYVTLIFSAPEFQDIIYSFNYEIVSAIFEINIESFHLSELYVNTYITASENGNYQVYENNTAIPSESPTPFFSIGTSIQTDRDTTEGAFINYAIKFWNAAEDTIWFNTTYSNTEGIFFVTSYSVNIGDTTITVTWATSLIDSDKLTVKEDGANKVTEDSDSPSDWVKSTVVGTHSVTLLFEADGYTTVTYSFNYHVYAVADFQVDIGSFQVSDDYVNTYASSNYDGSYYVYEDNEQIDTSTLYGAGTVIETDRDTTAGSTIAYAVKFVYESTEIWFNTTYSNPITPFYLTDYRVEDGSTITVTWDTTLPALDSLTIYEDGVLIEDSDTESTTTWSKSTDVGNHYVTLIFSSAGYDDIIHSFAYTVYPPAVFIITVESFYVSDDYLNVYLTATFDYTYIVYENDENIGSGNGVATGTIIISPKNSAAGLYNFTIIFTYESTNRSFMTWYSNLVPPPTVFNSLYRDQSEGYFNITLITNIETFWIDIYHDSVLIVDDSTDTFYAILKALKVGWHNITFDYIYNVSTDDEGYPIAEYNETISYSFWYETKAFYDVRLRYVPIDLGLSIGEFSASWVHTYIDGNLTFSGDIDDVPEYSNYSYISDYEVRIRNNMPIHNLVVKDLFDRLILNTTIDISKFTYAVLELPIYRLGVINLDDESHKLAIRPYLSGDEWQRTPEIAPGHFLEFWVCNRTYSYRIYSVGTSYYDNDGVLITIYDDYYDLPPKKVPVVIIIPLIEDVEDPTPTEDQVQWGLWVSVATLALVVLTGVILLLRSKKKKGLNK